MEFLPILQDFVLSRGRCPATLCNLKTAKKQGMGTADHMMRLDNWFIPSPAAGHSNQLSLWYCALILSFAMGGNSIPYFALNLPKKSFLTQIVIATEYIFFGKDGESGNGI